MIHSAQMLSKDETLESVNKTLWKEIVYSFKLETLSCNIKS